MKKLLFTIVCSLSVVVSVNAGNILQNNSAKLSGSCGENLTWKFDPQLGSLDITGSGPMFDYGYYDSDLEADIETPWNKYIDLITTIHLPEGLTVIGESAFSGCRKIKSITIPKTVTTIRHFAFGGCQSLEAVHISDLASWCAIYFHIYSPDGEEYIDDIANPLYYAGHLFLNGKEITDLKIPAGVKKISSYAFYGCTALKSVSIPNSVTEIGDYAFAGCQNIQQPIYNANIFAFLPYSYSGKFVIPSGIKRIAHGAFANCDKLTELVIPNGIVEVDEYMFYNCTKLRSISLPNSLKRIGYMAFAWCQSLTSITIPNSVESIAPDAFDNLPNIVYTGSAEGAPWGAGYLNGVVDGDLIFYDDTKTKIVGSNKHISGNVVIPNGVKIIGKGAFDNRDSLVSITLPEGVTTIEARAFHDCSNLSSVRIPSTITYIGENAFSSVNHLKAVYITNITAWCNIQFEYDANPLKKAHHLYLNNKEVKDLIIPNGVTEIKRDAFNGCSALSSITLPESVLSIGESAFSGCTGVTKLIVPKNVQDIKWYSFTGVRNITYDGNERDAPWGAYCQNGYVDGWLVYRNATKKELVACSTNAKGKIVIPNSVTTIGKYAFQDCIDITEVIIPNSVTSIPEYAFSGCKNLTNVVLPNALEHIGDDAFAACSSLKTVDIPNSVKTIGRSAFSDCINLVNVVVPDSVKTVEYYAFDDVVNVIYHGPGADDWRPIWRDWGAQHVNCIVDSCFIYSDATRKQLIDYCPTHKGAVVVPKGVEEIGYGCFDQYPYQDSLTAITLPNTLKIIGENAFASCEQLTSIIIPNSVKKIGKRAFSYCTGLTSVIIPKDVIFIGESAFDECFNLKELYYPKTLDMSDAEVPIKTNLIPYDPKRPITSASLEPPMLTLVPGSVSFTDDTKDNCIDAGEKAYVHFMIKNKGKGFARNCEARVKITKGDASWINIHNVSLPLIPAGDTYQVSMPITANSNLKDGKITMAIEVYEPNGWGVAPFDITVATKAYEAPLIQVVDYNVASASGKVQKMEAFTLTFNLQNTKYGTAENVEVNVQLPGNVFLMDGDTEFAFPQLKAGEAKPIHIVLVANNHYKAQDIPIFISVTEKFGKYAENKQLSIALNQEATGSVVITSQNDRKPIELALLSSDVDRDIPTTNNQNKNTFAVIIGNEMYDNVDAVPYAQNDARIFQQYCEKTLGIPNKNIREYTNATKGQIQGAIDWLNEISKAFNKPNFIIYYAGHGVPDEMTKESYLLPKDGYANNLNTCYKLNDFYEALGNMKAEKIIVFLDACFSGAKPSGKVLNFGKRGIAIKADPGKPQGNTIVLAATTKEEPAYPYNEKQHGMFTYYLLKKMQTDADITLGKLFEYIKEQVTQQSVLENDKVQIPQPVPSFDIEETWQTWKLK